MSSSATLARTTSPPCSIPPRRTRRSSSPPPVWTLLRTSSNSTIRPIPARVLPQPRLPRASRPPQPPSRPPPPHHPQAGPSARCEAEQLKPLQPVKRASSFFGGPSDIRRPPPCLAFAPLPEYTSISLCYGSHHRVGASPLFCCCRMD